MPKNLEILQLLKHILRVFPSLGGGKFNSVELDHSGSLGKPKGLPGVS